MNIRVLAPLLLTLIASSAFATTKSHIIPLQGGSATYNIPLVIQFENLLNDVKYSVTCGSLITDNATEGNISVIQVKTLGAAKVFINDNLVSNVNGQGYINVFDNNKIQVDDVDVDADQYIIIRNLDTKGTLTVDHCYAYPKISS